MILPSHSIIRIPFHIEYIYLIFVKKKFLLEKKRWRDDPEMTKIMNFYVLFQIFLEGK